MHHSAPMDAHSMSEGATCVAVLAVGALAVLALTPAARRLPRPANRRTLRHWLHLSPRSVPARAGPVELQVLRL